MNISPNIHGPGSIERVNLKTAPPEREVIESLPPSLSSEGKETVHSVALDFNKILNDCTEGIFIGYGLVAFGLTAIASHPNQTHNEKNELENIIGKMTIFSLSTAAALQGIKGLANALWERWEPKKK